MDENSVPRRRITHALGSWQAKDTQNLGREQDFKAHGGAELVDEFRMRRTRTEVW
jgi:hypothetical protein